MNPATATEWTIGLAILLAALAMFCYVKALWGPGAGILAAILYTYYPYHLIDAYVRGAMPELAAFIFPPLILWMTTRAMQTESARAGGRAMLWHALAWTGLVFTHNLSALLMALIIVPYALLLAWRSGRWRRLMGWGASLVMALALTAVYWMPVLSESAGMGLGEGPSRGYENHLLPVAQIIARTFSHDYRAAYDGPVVHPQNWFTAALLIAVASLLLWRWRQRRPPGQTAILLFHLLLAVVAIFMTTTLSLPIWHPLTPLLGFLQYPWRFLSLSAVGVAASGGALIALLTKDAHLRLSRRQWGALTLAFVLALLTSLPQLPYQALPLTLADVWFPERMWQEDAEMGQVGATWTGEFLPRTVTEQRWALGRPREGAVDTPPLPGPPRVQLDAVQLLGLSFSLETPARMSVRLHQFQTSGWHARVDGAPAPTRASGELGLSTVDLQQTGRRDISFFFGPAPGRIIGAWLSALAALLWALLAWRAGREGRWLRLTAGVVAAATFALMLNSGGVGRASHTPQPVQVQVGDVAQIIASDVQPARVPGYLEVTLYWLALKENATDYHVFVHVLDPSGQVIAQHDGFPVGGFTPTTRWRPGEIIKDAYHIRLPSDLPPGDYRVKTGMYAYGDVIQNLPTTPPQSDDRVDVGAITLP
jgi:hypothetical protein